MDSINRGDAYRYMGLRGEPDQSIITEVDRCERLLLETVKPAYVWRVFDLERGGESESALRLLGCKFALEGDSIARHLEGCYKAAALAVTLSADADRLIKKAALADGLSGLAMDALSSAYVEQVLEQARGEVIRETGLFSTWCFAAGYGDFPLGTAADLIACVDGGRRIGLCVTASGMLTPQKSIVGIAGLSETELNGSRRSCSDCGMSGRCQFQKNGNHCD